MEGLATLKEMLKLDIVRQSRDLTQLALIAEAAVIESDGEDAVIEDVYRNLSAATANLVFALERLS
jgi:hypothetical protein